MGGGVSHSGRSWLGQPPASADIPARPLGWMSQLLIGTDGLVSRSQAAYEDLVPRFHRSRHPGATWLNGANANVLMNGYTAFLDMLSWPGPWLQRGTVYLLYFALKNGISFMFFWFFFHMKNKSTISLQRRFAATNKEKMWHYFGWKLSFPSNSCQGY